MKGNLNRSDHAILAVVAAFGVYVFLFVYFQLTEYKQYIEIEVAENLSRIEDNKQIEIPIKNIEIPNVSSKEIKNIARNNEDKRIKSNKDWSQNTPSGSPEKTIKDFEKKIFEEAKLVRESKTIKKTGDKVKPEKTVVNSNSKDNNQDGKTNQYSGNVMVDFYLPGRTAYDNNNWNIRNPGYTCGFGSSGTVVINVKVNLNGKVLKITYDASQSSNATACMIEQAKKYAQISRFNFSGEASNEQSGYIRYQFISQ
jgi:hypothetical protein